jgi:hypothetical protein
MSECGSVSGTRRSSSSELACVDHDARRGAEEASRRQRDAEARARAEAYYASTTTCSAATTCGGSTPSETPDPAAAAQRARIDAVVQPGRKLDTLDALTTEILRLRCVAPASSDAALKSAVAARLGALTAEWCARATASGMKPPASTFDPYRATNADLTNAFLWVHVAGVVPVDVAMHDGSAHFRDDLFEAVALRTPGLDDELLASYASQPGTQRILLERELQRLGDTRQCGTGETNAVLLRRRAELLHSPRIENDPSQRYIGLDGRQGTLEQLVDYELEQRVLAMNPGTTAGAIAAGVSANRGGTTEDIRAAGELGNTIEGIAQGAAGVDPRTIGPKPSAPTPSGRRRPRPAGPGLGRRTQNAGGAVPRRGTNEVRSTTRSRTPTGINDKHLAGEIRNGRAVGFHLEAASNGSARVVPGTASKPDKHGVYKATVEIKDPATGQWVTKRTESTLFPKGWTRSEVRTAILEAFANRKDLGNGNWEGKLANGMMIVGHCDANGYVDSAYPIREDD